MGRPELIDAQLAPAAPGRRIWKTPSSPPTSGTVLKGELLGLKISMDRSKGVSEPRFEVRLDQVAPSSSDAQTLPLVSATKMCATFFGSETGALTVTPGYAPRVTIGLPSAERW